jgi:hypothetical protein
VVKEVMLDSPPAKQSRLVPFRVLLCLLTGSPGSWWSSVQGSRGVELVPTTPISLPDTNSPTGKPKPPEDHSEHKTDISVVQPTLLFLRRLVPHTRG